MHSVFHHACVPLPTVVTPFVFTMLCCQPLNPPPQLAAEVKSLQAQVATLSQQLEAAQAATAEAQQAKDSLAASAERDADAASALQQQLTAAQGRMEAVAKERDMLQDKMGQLRTENKRLNEALGGTAALRERLAEAEAGVEAGEAARARVAQLQGVNERLQREHASVNGIVARLEEKLRQVRVFICLFIYFRSDVCLCGVFSLQRAARCSNTCVHQPATYTTVQRRSSEHPPMLDHDWRVPPQAEEEVEHANAQLDAARLEAAKAAHAASEELQGLDEANRGAWPSAVRALVEACEVAAATAAASHARAEADSAAAAAETAMAVMREEHGAALAAAQDAQQARCGAWLCVGCVWVVCC